MPTVGPFLKGLAVTVPLHLSHLKAGTDADALYQTFKERYADEPFVTVHAPDDQDALDGGFFDVQGSNDTNRVELFLFGNGERQCVVARLDNLGKGAAGAAVQNMNVHLGIDETTSLTV